jgi:hypothetical protein
MWSWCDPGTHKHCAAVTCAQAGEWTHPASNRLLKLPVLYHAGNNFVMDALVLPGHVFIVTCIQHAA